MAAKYHANEQMLELASGDAQQMDRMPIAGILLTGTAAGAFVFVIGETTLTVSTGAAQLSMFIPWRTHANYAKLTSGPAGATAYIMFDQRP